jgi:hypothetical protein
VYALLSLLSVHTYDRVFAFEYNANCAPLRGRWNGNLKGGGGWIFPATTRPALDTLLESLNPVREESVNLKEESVKEETVNEE